MLPTSPPASMSVSQILAEFGITAGTTKRISTDLFPLVGGTAGSQCFLGASFSGKSTGMLLAYSYIIGGTIYYNITDSSQNMYVTGTYNSATTVPINTFSTAPSASGFSLPVTTGSDGFVIKWNANGTVGGYTTIKGTGGDITFIINRDSSQNIYAGGSYSSTATVPINTLSTAPSASGFSLPVTAGLNLNDMFIIKWNANGTVGGYTTLRGTGGDAAYSLRVDSSQNIYAVGFYNSTATVPINTFSTASSASGFSLPAASTGSDMFVIKWNGSNGTVGGYTTLKGTGGDGAYSLAVDSSQNIYAVGYYSSTATVPINTFSTAPSASGFSLPVTTGTHSFVIKWNGSNGTVGGYTTIRGSTNESIVLDSSQNIYVTGFYNSATTVPINTFSTAPSASGFSLPVTTGTDSFVIKWNANGTVGGYTTIKGTGGDITFIINRDSSQNIYAGGSYSSTATVPINTLSTASSASGFSLPVTTGSDGFVIKWNANGTVGGYTTLKGTGGDGAYSLEFDSSQNKYVSGAYVSTATVPINTFSTAPSASGFSLPAASTGGGFIIKWNA